MKGSVLIIILVFTALYCHGDDTSTVRKNNLKVNLFTPFNTYPTYELGYERIFKSGKFGFEIALGIIQGPPINKTEEKIHDFMGYSGLNQRHGFRLVLGPKFYIKSNPQKHKQKFIYPCVTYQQVADQYSVPFEIHPDRPVLGVEDRSFDAAYKKEFIDISLRYGSRSLNRINMEVYIGAGIKFVRITEDIDVELKDYQKAYWRIGYSPVDGSVVGANYIEDRKISFSIPFGFKLGYRF